MTVNLAVRLWPWWDRPEKQNQHRKHFSAQLSRRNRTQAPSSGPHQKGQVAVTSDSHTSQVNILSASTDASTHEPSPSKSVHLQNGLKLGVRDTVEIHHQVTGVVGLSSSSVLSLESWLQWNQWLSKSFRPAGKKQIQRRLLVRPGGSPDPLRARWV